MLARGGGGSARALRAAARRLSSSACSAPSSGSDGETLDADVVVIGGGVVGLATARELARAGREVLLLEAAADVGTGTSSRSSEGACAAAAALRCAAARPHAPL
jgi:NADPH-dependent 2,4-dienoyl-CoA reductase/sulfur reductase-like enzyme